jgi:multiple sugar transport system substrate-binding protein
MTHAGVVIKKRKPHMKRRTAPILVSAGLVGVLALTGCGQAGEGGGTSEDGRTQLTMWTHSAGNEAELEVYERIISDFNDSQDQYEVVHESFPQGAYNDALAIFARESVLTENGIRIPTAEEPWAADEFNQALATLKAAGYETPIDIGAEDTGEWWPYAYSPLLQSFGGDLIDRSSMLSSEGVLNGPEAVAWGEWFAGLFADGFAGNSGTIGNQEFVDDEVALSYTGVWNAVAALDAVGDDLLILPPPDLGNGPKIGGGSWQWAISSECNDADGAREYLEFSFQDEYITEFADKQVVIPATDAAAQASEYFSDDGALRPFVEYSQEYAELRPETPAYAVISTTFETAAKDIMSGADVQQTLDRAVSEIDANIESNDGYGFQ